MKEPPVLHLAQRCTVTQSAAPLQSRGNTKRRRAACHQMRSIARQSSKSRDCVRGRHAKARCSQSFSHLFLPALASPSRTGSQSSDHFVVRKRSARTRKRPPYSLLIKRSARVIVLRYKIWHIAPSAPLRCTQSHRTPAMQRNNLQPSGKSSFYWQCAAIIHCAFRQDGEVFLPARVLRACVYFLSNRVGDFAYAHLNHPRRRRLGVVIRSSANAEYGRASRAGHQDRLERQSRPEGPSPGLAAWSSPLALQSLPSLAQSLCLSLGLGRLSLPSLPAQARLLVAATGALRVRAPWHDCIAA